MERDGKNRDSKMRGKTTVTRAAYNDEGQSETEGLYEVGRDTLVTQIKKGLDWSARGYPAE